MKYQVVLQHNQEDCGSACLASIAKYYGRIFSLNRTREATGNGQLGTTLLNLKQGSQQLGFNARGVKVSIELVDQKIIPLPGIIHWLGNHWVVLYGKKGSKYVIADPASGIRYLSKVELLASWTNGGMLLLEPRPNFHLTPDDRNKIGGLWKFFGRFWNYRNILLEALLLNFAVAVLSLSAPFLIQILTDDVLVRNDRQLLSSVAIAILLMNLISSSLKFVQSNLIAHFAQRLELDLTLEFGRQILNLPLAYYEVHRSGEITSRLRDIQEINRLIYIIGFSLPGQIFIGAVSLLFIFIYSPNILIIPIIIALIMSLSTFIFQPQIQQSIRNLLALSSENQGLLIESFKGALIMKSMNAVPHFWEEFQSQFGRIANLSFRTTQIAIINNTFSGLAFNAGGIIILWFGSTLVMDKALSIGQLLAINSLSANFLDLINTILNFVPQITRTQAATERLMEVIESTPETSVESRLETVTISANADIIFSNLNFHHPGRIELLKDINLIIPGGKIIAIIGKSGCGKSTLAKLIASLYQPKSGNIRIGQYNLQDISLNCLREQVILVPQDAHFWSRSIIENLRLGYSQTTFEQVITACQIANADEFISKLPNKYQTIIGEFGANLSGGQRQRLGIARGIITDPPILILDESTAGLDPLSEVQVLNQLLSHRQGKTTILISHRPQVIKHADWIISLEEGRVKLQGTPKDLLSQSGEHLNFLVF
ncbi:MAG: peptidase domain-containing ABC transporter (plasmid) [Dolichospermum sp. DET50]|nr:peptidase domain-containing ABC transporter [Dolichospermum sp. DET66]MBS3035923.1 peptidase domain-containing ABC transporter [Dolichospermum sp. DET67]MBS3041091.1 peptidase domain-containing ABC transporter [Dolichospermum sp. DET50]QSX70974.1 MAG: peptidase domain-containing ABC transporter [Dolichospermum sp. DET69]